MSELMFAKACVGLLMLSIIVGAIFGAWDGRHWSVFEGAVTGAVGGFLATAITIIVAIAFWFGVRFVCGVGA